MAKRKVPTWIWYAWPAVIVAIVLIVQLTAGDEVASSAGKKLYERHCQTCHMADGEGLGKLVPPLAGADYVIEGGAELACLIRYGLKGPITVNGEVYNRPMPGFQELPAVEVRNILLYIRSAWGNTAEDIPFESVREALNRCAPVASND